MVLNELLFEAFVDSQPKFKKAVEKAHEAGLPIFLSGDSFDLAQDDVYSLGAMVIWANMQGVEVRCRPTVGLDTIIPEKRIRERRQRKVKAA